MPHVDDDYDYSSSSSDSPSSSSSSSCEEDVRKHKKKHKKHRHHRRARIYHDRLRRLANNNNKDHIQSTVVGRSILVRPTMADATVKLCNAGGAQDRMQTLTNLRHANMTQLEPFDTKVQQSQQDVLQHAQLNMTKLATNMARDLFIRIISDAVDVGLIDKKKALDIGTNAELAIEVLEGNVNDTMASMLHSIAVSNRKLLEDEEKLKVLQQRFVTLSDAVTSYRQAVEAAGTENVDIRTDPFLANRMTTLESIASERAKVEADIVKTKENIEISRARFFEAKQQHGNIDSTLASLGRAVIEHFGDFVSQVKTKVLPSVNLQSFSAPTTMDDGSSSFMSSSSSASDMKRQPLVDSYLSELRSGLERIIKHAVLTSSTR